MKKIGIEAWIRRWWRPLVGELVSTALLVSLGTCSQVSPANVTTQNPPPAPGASAVAFGLVTATLVHVFGPVSGAHMNPAVTLAAAVGGHLRPVPALAYVVAQLCGALTGFGALVLLLPPHFTVAPFGCTVPLPEIGAAAAALEGLLAAALALLASAVWVERDRPDHSAPLKFGLLVVGLAYSGSPLTGASFNPARSFAPALFHGFWQDHWVYWVGPLSGAAMAALLHRWVLAAGHPAPPPPPRPLLRAAPVLQPLTLNDNSDC